MDPLTQIRSVEMATFFETVGKAKSRVLANHSVSHFFLYRLQFNTFQDVQIRSSCLVSPYFPSQRF